MAQGRRQEDKASIGRSAKLTSDVSPKPYIDCNKILNALVCVSCLATEINVHR